MGRTTTSGLGRYGEQVAARRLAEDGLRILDRNWRCADGELDIVALDGDTLAVCEVKTRSERGFQQPSEAIDKTKAERLHRLAERWMAERWGHHFARLAAGVAEADPADIDADSAWSPPVPPGGVRIDLVAVINRTRGAASVDHLRGVI
ncbi:YraN family protein [Kitasatospora sp. NPDC054939]